MWNTCGAGYFGSHRLDWLGRVDTFFIGSYPVRLMAAANLVFLLAIGIVLFFRYTRVAHAQMRTAAEFEASREIQRKLVPRELPPVENCSFAAAYVPAEEVGSDFYQVLQQPDGSALITLGDVSGKGLKAAMTSGLVIGALRTLAAEGAPGCGS
jgi:Stage II sporulation protein E (SpoIIE)